MRTLLLALLLPVVIACQSGQGSNGPSQPADAQPGANSVTPEQAAQRACSVYGEALLWDGQDIDTNGDGVDDFTEVFPAEGSEQRLAGIATSAAVARQEPKFTELAAAAEFLVLIYKKGGDRSEVSNAEVGMTEACNNIGKQQN